MTSRRQTHGARGRRGGQAARRAGAHSTANVELMGRAVVRHGTAAMVRGANVTWVLELSKEASLRIATFQMVADIIERSQNSPRPLRTQTYMFTLPNAALKPSAGAPSDAAFALKVTHVMTDWEERVVLARVVEVERNVPLHLVVATASGVTPADVRGISAMAATFGYEGSLDFRWWNVSGFELIYQATYRTKEW